MQSDKSQLKRFRLQIQFELQVKQRLKRLLILGFKIQFTKLLLKLLKEKYRINLIKRIRMRVFTSKTLVTSKIIGILECVMDME